MPGYIKKAAATAKAKAKTTKSNDYNAAWQQGYNAGQTNAQRGKLRGAEGPKQSMPRKPAAKKKSGR